MPASKRSAAKPASSKPSGPKSRTAATKATPGDAIRPAAAPPAIVIPPDVINNVVELMLRGTSGFEVTRAVVAAYQQYSVGDVLRAVGDHFMRAGQAEPSSIRGFCIEAYREIYRKALAEGDLETALKSLARLERTAAG